jgi:hypothetical protein
MLAWSSLSRISHLTAAGITIRSEPVRRALQDQFAVILPDRVPASTCCPRCRKTGLVRFERVIRGGRTARHFYCGACAYSWVAADADEQNKQRTEDDDLPSRGER